MRHWVLPLTALQDVEFDAKAMEQEVAIMKKVDHPNCIKLHEVIRFDLSAILSA
jgi:hypothetical protein